MEPFITSSIASLFEETVETAAVNESNNILLTEMKNIESGTGLGDFKLTNESIQSLNETLNNNEYAKLAEFREVSETNPDAAARQYMNDIHVKGQAGEGIMKASLSRFGEVNSQIHYQLEGAEKANIIDLQLVEAKENIKQIELTIDEGRVISDYNYDLIKGDSASFEVKNGGLEYLRQEIVSGDLPQQIEAGKEISDQSYVIINEDTAKRLIENPDAAEVIINKIQESGGKLIVGLPAESIQMAIFLS